jgi:3-dehydroquinate synthase
MPLSEIKVKNQNSNYSIIIGNNILNILPNKINKICPNAKKIGLIVDSKVPKKYKFKIKKILKRYQVFIFEYKTNEQLKSFKNVNALAEKCISKKFNRSDIIIALGGGILGDFSAFTSSIIKRGINFINIPTTLLAQVDSSVGGKTGVNSKYGKNLIGSFYEPKLVISDVSFLRSLPKREIVCGYAEILKHSLILNGSFFNWLKSNSNKILNGMNLKLLQNAILKSCKVKLNFVNKDLKEKNVRMMLNFGHSFAHAIEAKNNFSKRINHGEAVLMGMMMAVKLSYIKKICSYKTLLDIQKVYNLNNLNYRVNNFFKKKEFFEIINFMNNDKKNNDNKLNLILLKKIGQTTKPGNCKISINELERLFSKII